MLGVSGEIAESERGAERDSRFDPGGGTQYRNPKCFEPIWELQLVFTTTTI
jgi:hypothetical protein